MGRGFLLILEWITPFPPAMSESHTLAYVGAVGPAPDGANDLEEGVNLDIRK